MLGFMASSVLVDFDPRRACTIIFFVIAVFDSHFDFFTLLNGFSDRKELLRVLLSFPGFFSIPDPGLILGDRTNFVETSELSVDDRDRRVNSEKTSSSSSSSSLAEPAMETAERPWKHSICTCSCDAETR